jgi:hypothetical protein
MSKTVASIFGVIASLALLLGVYELFRTPVAAPEPPAQPALLGAAGGLALNQAMCKTVVDSGAVSASCPSSWTQAAWFIDPANVSTCASDSNKTCGQSTCTAGVPGVADGPCLSYAQVAARWGTYSPRLLQNTTLTWLSSQVGLGDPVYLTPYVENQSWVAIVGTLVSQGTATLGTVVALNTGTPTLLTTTLTGATGSQANGQLVVNSTHPSRLWTYKNSAGTWTLSTPFAAATAGAAPPSAATGWTNATNSGDAVTFFAPTTVQIVQFQPILVSLAQASAVNNAVILNVTIPSPGSTDKADPLLVNQWVNIFESRVTPMVSYAPTADTNPVPNAVNDCFDIGVRGGAALAAVTRPNYTGGIMNLGAISFSQFNATGAELLSNIIMAGTTPTLQYGVVGGAYLETGVTLTITGAGNFTGAAAVWGPGNVNVQGNSKINYASGAGSAGTTFANTGTLNADTQTKVCSSPPSDAGPPGCNLTLSASQLDTSLGTTSGCLYVPGGASYCNIN